MCAAIGKPNGGKYATHSPQRSPPTTANQLKFDQRELNIVGPHASEMPETYGRSACAVELLRRNTVIDLARGSWGLAPALRVPETVVDTTGIGHDNALGCADFHISISNACAV